MFNAEEDLGVADRALQALPRVPASDNTTQLVLSAKRVSRRFARELEVTPRRLRPQPPLFGHRPRVDRLPLLGDAVKLAVARRERLLKRTAKRTSMRAPIRMEALAEESTRKVMLTKTVKLQTRARERARRSLGKA